MKLHTGEKPHICDDCGNRFSRADALVRHVKGPGICKGSKVKTNNKNDKNINGKRSQNHEEIDHELNKRMFFSNYDQQKSPSPGSVSGSVATSVNNSESTSSSSSTMENSPSPPKNLNTSSQIIPLLNHTSNLPPIVTLPHINSIQSNYPMINANSFRSSLTNILNPAPATTTSSTATVSTADQNTRTVPAPLYTDLMKAHSNYLQPSSQLASPSNPPINHHQQLLPPISNHVQPPNQHPTLPNTFTNTNSNVNINNTNTIDLLPLVSILENRILGLETRLMAAETRVEYLTDELVKQNQK